MNHILCHWCPVRLCLRINFSGDYVSIKVLRSRTLGYLVCPWYSTFALFLIQIKIWHTKNFFSLAIFDIAYNLFFLNLKINCWQVVKLSGNVAGKTGPNPAGCWISVQSHSHLNLSADWLPQTHALLNCAKCALFSFGLKMPVQVEIIWLPQFWGTLSWAKGSADLKGLTRGHDSY